MMNENADTLEGSSSNLEGMRDAVEGGGDQLPSPDEVRNRVALGGERSKRSSSRQDKSKSMFPVMFLVVGTVLVVGLLVLLPAILVPANKTSSSSQTAPHHTAPHHTAPHHTTPHGGNHGPPIFSPTFALPVFTPTAAPVTPEPTKAPVGQDSISMEQVLSLYVDASNLDDSSSYQGKSVGHMQKDDTSQLYASNMVAANDDDQEYDVWKRRLLQRYALLCLLHATDGVQTPASDAAYGEGSQPIWPKEYRWDLPPAREDEECTWFGVTCNNNDLVVEIDLSDHRLTGQLPREIIHLPPTFKSLILDGNPGIGGILPDFLGELSGLEELLIEGTSYEGSIPTAVCALGLTRFHVDCADVECDSECCTNCAKPPAGRSDLEEILKTMINAYNEQNPMVNLQYPEEADSSQKAFNHMGFDTVISNYTEVQLVQRYALLSLFFATNDVSTNRTVAEAADIFPWKAERRWNKNDVVDCDFYGVTCDTYHIVTEVELSDSNLSGELPAEVALLVNLDVLDVSSNANLGLKDVPLFVVHDMPHLKLLDVAGTGFETVPADGKLCTNSTDIDALKIRLDCDGSAEPVCPCCACL